MTIASQLRTRATRWALVAVTALGLSVGCASLAQADFGITPGTFTAEVTSDAAHTLYTQAGGHPYGGSTSFQFNTHLESNGWWDTVAPDGDIRDIVVQLPAGFVGNPKAAATCDSTAKIIASAQQATQLCPADSQVGITRATFPGLFSGDPQTFTEPVFNIDPLPGDAATFAFSVLGVVINIHATVRTDGDYGITTTIPRISEQVRLLKADLTLWGVPASPVHTPERGLTCSQYEGQPLFCAGGNVPSGAPLKAFLTNPSDCSAPPAITSIAIDSWQQPGRWLTDTATSPALTGCDQQAFNPVIAVRPDTQRPDTPTGLHVDLSFPQDGLVNPDGVAAPPLKKATVTLPEGMTINPAGAGGLTACSDAQLQLKSKKPVTCPESAKVGTVTATTPLLDDRFSGGIYIRSQNSMDPESGEMFRIALVLENEERGISIRLPGSIRADARTGRLVTTFDNNPQLPVSDIKLTFKSGPRAPLVTPATCGEKTVDAQLTSWGGQSADLQSKFTIDCTAGLGWFGPSFAAGTVAPVAGSSSPFVLRAYKPDGQADLNQLALVLPEGLLGNLKGNMGRRVGTARVAAGPGSNPFWLSGPVVLEGPYKGAPFSLRVTVPAIAGPFNLGNVVVRQRIYVDSHDAHVTVVSDPLPTIVKGVPVRLHALAVDVDKPGFMRNPTSCAPKVIHGTLGSVFGQYAEVSSRFQVGDCASLPLKPRMKMELEGKDQTKRGKHPTLVTTLTQQPGESALKKVKVRLPLSLALDPDNAQALCKPEQAAAQACPAGSIVGKATAITPVLDEPLAGNVYFVEGTRKSKTGRTVKTLPKLWVALRGQVSIDLWADSAIGDGKYLVTTFGFVPDAPISSFRLDINGGKHGILAVTGDSDANLCQRRLITDATFDGQNGKRVTDKVHMGSPCGFGVRKKSVDKGHARVTVSGLGAGKLSISGKGIHKASRTIKHSDVATIRPRLNQTGKRLSKGRKAIRLKVKFNPKAKGKKTQRDTVVVKRAKEESSSRSHRSR